MHAEVVTAELPFGEGPVWCPDGTLVCTSVSHGALYRVWPESGRIEPLADTGGGANGAALATDGSFVVAQNGGIDLVARGHVKSAPAVRWKTPGLQRAFPDGRVTALTREAMQAPNDLAIAVDGRIFFTDPGPYPPSGRIARIVACDGDGTTRVVADGFAYVNGIAFERDGSSLVVVEGDRRLLRLRDFGAGAEELVVADLGPDGGDGFCLDAEGRYYVAMRRGNAIHVYDTRGALEQRLPLEAGDGFVTNCCFGGADLRTLFATDARRSRVVAWEGMPCAGLPLPCWPAPGAEASAPRALSRA